MKIEGAASVALLKIRMQVDYKNETVGLVVEKDQFAAELPVGVAEAIQEGDWLEIICILNWAGEAEKVFRVERWMQGKGLGEVIYSADEYWEGVLKSRSPI